MHRGDFEAQRRPVDEEFANDGQEKALAEVVARGDAQRGHRAARQLGQVSEKRLRFVEQAVDRGQGALAGLAQFDTATRPLEELTDLDATVWW